MRRMSRQRRRPAVAGALWVLSCATLAACGGGGGGGGAGPVPAPVSIAYALPPTTWETGDVLLPLAPQVTGGAPDAFTVAPSLPAGLTLDPTSGMLSGAPTTPTPHTVYTVTGSNAGGSAQTTLDLTVVLARAENLAAKDPATFTDDDIRHFLGRTHFSTRTAEFDAVKAVGLPAYVDAMVDASDDTNAALESAAAGMLVNATDPVGLEGGFPSQAQVARYWMHLMLNNPQPFQDALAFFWHDHFASSTLPVESNATWFMTQQINLWRKQGSGNLRSLLLSMARDSMMLVWLDGILNTKNAPNENFAREWFELFSLGVDNGYTQTDIVQASKAFTGYRLRFDATTGQAFTQFDTNRHDTGPKTVLGVVIPGQNVTDDYQAVVDITIDNRPVAEFVSKKLFEYFCYRGPTSVPTDAMAALLRGNGYELKPLLKALFKSEAFYSPKSKEGRVKGPVEHLVGFCRATGLTPIDNKAVTDPAAWPQNLLRTVDTFLTTCAQRPSQPPSVNGWPVSEEWLSAQNMLDRVNGVRECIRDRTDQLAANGGVDPARALLSANPTSLEAVDQLALLLNVKLTDAERTQLANYLDTSYNATTGVVTPSPFSANNATHVSERVRGLLYILVQHPTYAVR